MIISAFKKNIRRSLTTLKYDVQNIHTRMDVLETLLEKIDSKLSGQPNIITSDKEDINIIDNDNDLHKAEDKLTNDALYRSNVVCIIQIKKYKYTAIFIHAYILLFYRSELCLVSHATLWQRL